MTTATHNYTGYGTEGELYQATRNLDITEIAKLIRKDLKDEIFAGLKFSVRIDRFSMGQSIDCTITDAPETFAVINPNFEIAFALGNCTHGISRYTDNAAALLKVVEKVVNKYNYDDSDGMIDYFSNKYYSHVSYCYKRFGV
jgi:hypothetical protein